MAGEATHCASSTGLQVPFGERAGLLYPPSAVDRGLACGCTCPGCGRRLLAKKGDKQRWHFSHYQGGGDEYCYETAVHRMAKQVLPASRTLQLPAWFREIALPDLDHHMHTGAYERPDRVWAYTQAREEEWMADMRPDVVAEDDRPATLSLLVEVKVSHAVDERKAGLVRKRGWAMLEINLSKLDPDAVLDDAFERAVLEDAPRFWIHSPACERGFARVQDELELQVANRNADILAERSRRDEARRKNEGQLSAQRRRKEQFLQKLRAPHLEDLKVLIELSSPAAARHELARLSERDVGAIDQARRRFLDNAPLPPFLSQIPDGWQLVDAHPDLWQLMLWGRFVRGQEVGAVIHTSKWVPQLGRLFGFNLPIKRLFDAKQKDWQRARREGYHRRYPYWASFFEKWENELIPCPFALVTGLAEQLCAASLLEVAGISEFEVIGTEPCLAAFQPNVSVRTAVARPTPPTPRETAEQLQVRLIDEQTAELEAQSEPYSVCVLCDEAFPLDARCTCGTKLRPRRVEPPPPGRS